MGMKLNACLVMCGLAAWMAGPAKADWQVIGSFSVSDCGFAGILCSMETADVVVQGATVYELPDQVKSVDSGPSGLGETGQCESTLGLTQIFAVYVGGDRSSISSYKSLSGRTAVFDCRRIN